VVPALLSSPNLFAELKKPPLPVTLKPVVALNAPVTARLDGASSTPSLVLTRRYVVPANFSRKLSAPLYALTNSSLYDGSPALGVCETVPLAPNVVKLPVDAVVAPMAVEFRPVEVTVAEFEPPPKSWRLPPEPRIAASCDPVTPALYQARYSAFGIFNATLSCAPLIPAFPLEEIVVAATVLGVVAPTVPLMLIEAVPVRFVTVPELGVPNAPPLTTGAPAVPTLTASAVATPVPSPETPVLMGRPVALVRTAADGVPKFGVTRVGLLLSTTLVVPVEVVTPVPPEATAIGVEALTVVKAPVDGVDAPIAPCKPVLVTAAFSTPLIFKEWLLASKTAGRKVV